MVSGHWPAVAHSLQQQEGRSKDLLKSYTMSICFHALQRSADGSSSALHADAGRRPTGARNARTDRCRPVRAIFPPYGDIASCMADACAGIWACNLIDGFWPAGATISTLQSGQVGVAALHSARSLLLHCTCRRSLLLQNHHDLETWRLPWHDSFQFFSSYPCRRQFHLAAA